MTTEKEELERSNAVLVSVKLDDAQSEWIRLDPETGVLDLPLSVIRGLSDWLKRYDMRPSTKKPMFRTVTPQR